MIASWRHGRRIIAGVRSSRRTANTSARSARGRTRPSSPALDLEGYGMKNSPELQYRRHGFRTGPGMKCLAADSRTAVDAGVLDTQDDRRSRLPEKNARVWRLLPVLLVRGARRRSSGVRCGRWRRPLQAASIGAAKASWAACSARNGSGVWPVYERQQSIGSPYTRSHHGGVIVAARQPATVCAA